MRDMVAQQVLGVDWVIAEATSAIDMKGSGSQAGSGLVEARNRVDLGRRSGCCSHGGHDRGDLVCQRIGGARRRDVKEAIAACR